MNFEDDHKSVKKYMQLKFDVRFPSESKCYYIASNIPFSYFDIVKDMIQTEVTTRGPEDNLPQKPPSSVVIEKQNLYYERKVLTHTICGLPLF